MKAMVTKTRALKKKDFFFKVDNLIQDYPKGDVGELMRMRCALEKLWLAYRKALNLPAGLENLSFIDAQMSAYQTNKWHCWLVERFAADLLECHRHGFTKHRREGVENRPLR